VSVRGLALRALDHLPGLWHLRGLFAEQPLALLESLGPPSELGRFSLLCGEPLLTFECLRGQAFVGPPGGLAPVEGKPLDVLEALLARYRPERPAARPELPPLLGGFVGYLGYHLLGEIEPSVPRTQGADPGLADASLTLFGVTIALDQLTRRGWLCVQAFADDAAEAEAQARQRLDAVEQRLARWLDSDALHHAVRSDADEAARLVERRRQRLATRPRLDEAALRDAGFVPDLTRAQYLALVSDARERIFDGDLFEICTAQRLLRPWQGSAERLYSVLRTINPAPMAAYLRLPGCEVLCSSPERFVSLDRSGRAQTRPIKGTRPRGRTPDEDEAQRRALEASDKDRAENLMIVDLARNDLGRVCRFGTVRASRLLEVEPYPFTFQLVSTVEGTLREGLGPIDLLRAAFPGGSMTGAPKVEAMRTLDRLEPVERGLFAGSIGYFDLEGAVDLNIVIRTLVYRGGQLSLHVGGAIVSDSVPEDEYQETLDKAHGLVIAVELAEG
jgi:para-aminobenzoate synthetase component 1